MKRALLFHVAPAEQSKVRRALLPLKIGVRVIPREQYLQSLGCLLGARDLPRTEERYEGEELGGPMILFAGLSGSGMGQALTALQKQGVPRSCLKASLTATNAFWNVLQLYGEIRKEHDAMEGQT